MRQPQIIIRSAIASVWILTAMVVLWIYPMSESIKLVQRIGIADDQIASVIVYSGALLDILMGILTLAYPNKTLWRFQLIITITYSICIALYLPEYLIHPFGPVLKNIPFLALIWLLYSETGKP